MTQHSYTVANNPGASFRGDLNNALAAIVSENSGATAPSTTFAYQFWADTSSDTLWQRNAANTAWISVMTMSTGDSVALKTHGATAKTTPVDADEFNIADSAASFGLKKVTLANLKSLFQTQAATTTAGTSTAFTATVPQTLGSYANLRLSLKLNQAPGASPTINVNGLGAVNWKYYDRNGVKQFINSTVAPSGWQSDSFYDGTDMVMQSIAVSNFNSCVKVNTANGYGSTNTRIRRFTNVIINTGSDITYADSATLGGSFTINTTGIYSISFSDSYVSADSAAITVNDSAPTGAPVIADILALDTAGASSSSNVGVTIPLSSGAVVRGRSYNGQAISATNLSMFTIARIG